MKPTGVVGLLVAALVTAIAVPSGTAQASSSAFPCYYEDSYMIGKVTMSRDIQVPEIVVSGESGHGDRVAPAMSVSVAGMTAHKVRVTRSLYSKKPKPSFFGSKYDRKHTVSTYAIPAGGQLTITLPAVKIGRLLAFQEIYVSPDRGQYCTATTYQP